MTGVFDSIHLRMCCGLMGKRNIVQLLVQRYTHLKLKPDDLITSGFFAIVRNANYVGETLIYLGFVGVPFSSL